jgi:hypothetical protein
LEIIIITRMIKMDFDEIQAQMNDEAELYCCGFYQDLEPCDQEDYTTWSAVE